MKKNTSIFSCLFIWITIIIIYFEIEKVYAFIPKVNEPNKQELESTSLQLSRTALQLIQFGQNKEAKKLLQLAIQLNPQEYALWISLAEAQVKTNENKEALISLNKAIILEPKKEDIYLAKASIYMNINKPKKAIINIKKGLSINKNSERGYFQLGNAEIMLKNYNSALIAFQKSSKINSNFWQSINNEGLVLYELHKPEKSIKKFKIALNISQNAEPMLALAVALFSSNKNYIESINLAKKALISNPNYVSYNYQTEQLWGEKLKKSTQLLFKKKEMIKAVKEANKKMSMN